MNLDNNITVNNQANAGHKNKKKIIQATLITVLIGAILFPLMLLLAYSSAALFTNNFTIDIAFELILFLGYPLLMILLGLKIFKAVLQPVISINSTAFENATNAEIISPSKFSKTWPYLLLILTLPAQYVVSWIISFILLCGGEGSGCSAWVALPSFVIILLPLNYIFIRCIGRKTPLQKIILWGLFGLAMVINISILFLWF